MCKRIISFFLAASMIMSLFGFSLSVSAYTVIENPLYRGQAGNHAIDFEVDVSEHQGGRTEATVGVVRGSITVVSHTFPISANGIVTGPIFAGMLSDADYYLVIFPGGSTTLIEREVDEDEYPVTFSVVGGVGGTIAATVGGTAIATGSEHPVGTSVVFTATPAEGYRVASWTVTGAAAPNLAEATATSITRTVAAGGLTVVVTFEEIPADAEPEITAVTISPDPASVVRGGTLQLSATVVGTGFPGGTPQGVTWTLITESPYLTLSAAGVLTVGNNFTGSSVGVRATSTVDPESVADSSVLYGERQISVTTPQAPQPPARPRPPEDGHGGGGHILTPIPTTSPGLGITQTPQPPRHPQNEWIGDAIGPDATPAFVRFTDVGMGEWFHDAITLAYYLNLMHGFPDGTFRPRDNVTRAQLVQVLANLANADTLAFAGASATFGDVPQGHWSFQAVQWAESVGFNLGFPDGSFRPDEPVTREQMASLFRRHATISNTTLQTRGVTPFVDQAAIGAWARDDVAAIQAAGVMSGREGNVFDPRANATRAELAQVLVNFLASAGRFG